MSSQKVRHPRATREDLFRLHAAISPGLKKMARLDMDDRPPEFAINQKDGPAGWKNAFDETFVFAAETQLLDSEVPHPLHHQPVLDRIMHLMDLHIGEARENIGDDRLSPGDVLRECTGRKM